MPTGVYKRTVIHMKILKKNLLKNGHPWNFGKKNPYITGKRNPNWKGKKVGYHGLHKWLERNFLKRGICDRCDEKRKTTWANKTNKYLRLRSDWLELCYNCHRAYDKKLTKEHRYSTTTRRKYRDD